MEKLLLKPEEAAEVLSVGRDRLYALIASGELRSLKLGRSRRIAVADLEAFVASRLASAAA